jgi:hypothetical protein
VPGGAWFPPFVETVIALSIVYMAIENIIGVDLRRRLLLTILFGPCTASVSRTACAKTCSSPARIFSSRCLPSTSGSEIGQLLVLAVMLPALAP